MFDGKAFGEEMVSVVRSYVDRATAPLVARIKELEESQAERREPGADGRDGIDGKDGIDGQPGERGADGTNGRDGADGVPGTDGKDGVGVAGALIDRDGGLVVTLSDGTTRELGRVIGKDGADGQAGSDGSDGAPGRDGADGFGFDDLTFEHDGERGFVLRFVQGERTKKFPFEVPVVLDRGVYRDGETYAKGDAVSWAGSLWIAQKETSSKPDSGDGFRLAVKRGRDGKDKL